MGFSFAHSDSNGLIDSGTITAIHPHPFPEYPTTFENTSLDSRDGQAIIQSGNADTRIRRWIWDRVNLSTPGYARLFEKILALQVSLREQRANATKLGALDTCTGSNGTEFGDDKKDAPPARIPDLGFGGWIIDRANSGIDVGYELQGNKGEQINGHGGGQGGKYCTDDVAHDNYTYFADIVPNDSTTSMGLGFRYEENPASGDGSGNYWEQNADGFELKMQGTGDDVNLRITRRVAGVATAFAANVNASPIPIPFRLGIEVRGSLVDIWREPIGGGTRTIIQNNVDLTETAGGNSEDFNDTGHMRLGIVSASADNLSTVDNLTVIVPDPNPPGWVFLKEDITNNFNKLVLSGQTWTEQPDFIRVKVISVTEKLSQRGGNVKYDSVEMAFYIDDDNWNRF